jgi:molybdopterin synthase sulfur carrier subunit
VLVKFFAGIRDKTGCRETNIPHEKNVRTLLHALSAKYGAGLQKKLLSDDGMQPGPEIIIFVNGRHLEHVGGIEAPLQPDDVVLVFPVVAGG